ncbi:MULTISPECIES: LysR family transcriptional regulator [Gordonia]|uniref:LysR family transcriptional regulator n=1 Tax=Gordonia tangerina TaxID=2911060 RepID=A0ABS9DLQ3_9ACTN|nr:LysR family transcriptional regulator [Gordonia tangerina]MCF3940163.1 LysR family transcriptional regulator [Gordonia tangerina]
MKNRDDLDLRRLRLFVTVAEAPSLRVAAEKLFMTQQAVSSAIKELERLLGVALFSRTRRSLALTPAGETLYRGAAALLAGGSQLTAMVQAAGAERLPPFVIGHTPELAPSEVFTIIEPVVVADPSVPITVRPIFADQVRGALLDGTIDLALRRGIQTPQDLAGTVAGGHVLRLAVASNHPLAHHARVGLADLAAHEIVVSVADPAEDSEYVRMLISICQGAGFEPRILVSRLRGTPPHTAVIAHPEACVFVTNESGWLYDNRIRILELTESPTVPVQAMWLPHTTSDIRTSILTALQP